MNEISKCLVFYSRNKAENETTLKFAKDNIQADQYITISDYPICDIYIDLKIYKISDLTMYDWNVVEKCIDFGEIIFKDRLLRNIAFVKAKDLILKIVKYSVELFSNKEYKYLIVHPVDNYVMDVLIRIAEFYKCKVFGVSSFFVSGYKRVTVYGEYVDFREVENEEIALLKNKLKNSFKSHMAISGKNAFLNSLLYYFKYKIKYLIFYIIKHKLLHDYKYDYASTPYSATVNSIGKLFPFLYFKYKENVHIDIKAIYIPMHYHPEATIEYWSDNIKNVDYITTLIEAIRYFSDNGWSVYLKEHPAMCFRQDIDLYRNILSIKNVIILNPFIETSYIMQKFENFLIWTGSSGIEALVNGKTVYFASSNYYYNKKTDSKYEKVFFNKEHEIDDFLKRILSNTIKWAEN
ncbi:hypothetical protein [Campylobacter sp. CCUG 57310]|uniref:hypothetical protein n=1 Tax=Campylobacter sp. CCUG 57310 TaxID=2517362 RepID=UPI0015665731|nr:hypothetical protein [Campylobacter sp. CCUG 57310]QKF91990.1 hypothetical protein CORI_0788 [Campylobacter sp. CCUG 57310]